MIDAVSGVSRAATALSWSNVALASAAPLGQTQVGAAALEGSSTGAADFTGVSGSLGSSGSTRVSEFTDVSELTGTSELTGVSESTGLSGSTGVTHHAAALEHRVSDPVALQQFNQFMQPSPGGTSVTAVRSPTALAPGDRILAGLDRHGATMTARWQSIQAMALRVGPEPSASALLHVSANMLQMSVEHELIGKVVSLSTRAVDGLTKLS